MNANLTFYLIEPVEACLAWWNVGKKAFSHGKVVGVTENNGVIVFTVDRGRDMSPQDVTFNTVDVRVDVSAPDRLYAVAANEIVPRWTAMQVGLEF